MGEEFDSGPRPLPSSPFPISRPGKLIAGAKESNQLGKTHRDCSEQTSRPTGIKRQLAVYPDPNKSDGGARRTSEN